MSDKRRCIGSTTFGIEAHDAPIEDFPVQPSQKDGLGRMCRPHWTEYTRALRKASGGTAGPKLPVGTGTPPVVHSAKRARNAPEPIRTRPARETRLMRSLREQLEEAQVAKKPEPTPKRQGAQFPAAGSQGDAG